MPSEKQRRKEDAVILAMAHAAMRGETLHVTYTDEASAKRLFDQAVRAQRADIRRIERNRKAP